MRLIRASLVAVCVALVVTAAAPARHATATASTLKRTGVVIDKRGMLLADAWTVSESQAQWTPPWGRSTYQYAMPSAIPPEGAAVTLTVTATANPGTRFAPSLGISGDVDIRGEAPFQATALAESGETKSASKTFTLVPRNHAPGSLVSVTVGLLDGARITFQYKAEGGGAARARAAIAWARSQLGSDKWAFRCQRFVQQAYGAPPTGFASANDAADRLGVRKRPLAGAPVGALVYFEPIPGRTSKFGHVGIYLGGGKFISAAGVVKIDTVAPGNVWHRSYRGWIAPPASWPGR